MQIYGRIHISRIEAQSWKLSRNTSTVFLRKQLNVFQLPEYKKLSSSFSEKEANKKKFIERIFLKRLHFWELNFPEYDLKNVLKFWKSFRKTPTLDISLSTSGGIRTTSLMRPSYGQQGVILFFEKIFKISRHFSNHILENSTLKNANVSRKFFQ